MYVRNNESILERTLKGLIKRLWDYISRKTAICTNMDKDRTNERLLSNFWDSTGLHNTASCLWI